MLRSTCLRGLCSALVILVASRSSTIEAQTLLVDDESKISESAGNFAGAQNPDPLDPGDSFGRSMSFVDRDGSRVAVGAPFDDEGGTDQGAVYVLTLSNGTVQPPYVKICHGSGSLDLDPGDRFGYGVASFQAAHLLGDLNGDTFSDLAVGAPGDDDGGIDKGAVYVLFLNQDGTVNGVPKKISETSGFAGPGFSLSIGDAFGDSICPLGDLDGDLVPDLAVGASNAGAIVDNGAVWILLMNTDGSVKRSQQITHGMGGFTGGLFAADRFGASVSAFDGSEGWDLNANGYSELVVGAPGHGDRGAAWVLFLDDDGTSTSVVSNPEVTGSFMGLLNNGDEFGQSVSCTVNGNDFALAVGIPRRDTGFQTDQGAVWILTLDSSAAVTATWEISDLTDPCTDITGPVDANDHFGISSSIAHGIFDGNFDLGIGAPYDDDGGFDQGAVWIVPVVMKELIASNVSYNDCTPPVNPDLLTATMPVVGATWTATFVRGGGGSGRFQIRVWSSRASFCNGLPPDTGSVPWPAGTSGRKLTAGTYLTSIPPGQSVGGSPVAPTLPYVGGVGTASGAIPCDPSFLGLPVAAQARSGAGPAGTGSPRLSSAVEGTIGTP